MDKAMIPELIEKIKNQMDEMDDVVHALQKELGIPDTVLAGIWAQLIWEAVQDMTNPYRATLGPEKVKDYKTAIQDALRIIETEFPLSVDLGPTVPTMGIRRVHRLIEELGEGGTVMSSPAVVAENATGDTIYRQAAIKAVGFYICHSGDKMLFAEDELKRLPPAEQSKPKILYRHFKGGVYEYLYTATDTETGDMMVIYKSVVDGKVWVRPAFMFYGLAPNGQEPRFVLIQDESGPV